jgi:hypothetical protein
MKNKNTVIFVFLNIILLVFYSCEDMATLFHGTKPEERPVTYTVTFNGNGADGVAPSAQTVNVDTIISLPGKGSLTSTGNIFMGWNEIATGGGATYSAGSSVKITKSFVFYAQWLDSSTPQYTVTFNVNGATGGVPPTSETVYNGVSIIIPNQRTLSYNGKIFAGWNTGADGLGINYTTGDIFLVTANTTLYAKWETDWSMVIPAKPTGLSASVISSSRIKITWNAVQGATGYKIYRSTGGEYTFVGTSSIAEYTNTGLSLSIMYYYKVSATNISGEGMQSDYIEISIEPPPAPSGVSAVGISDASIQISWNFVKDALFYEVHEKEYSGGYYHYSKLGTSVGTSYIDSGTKSSWRQAGRKRTYIVKTVNTLGTSIASKEVDAYTLPSSLTENIWYSDSPATLYGGDTTARYYSFPSDGNIYYFITDGFGGHIVVNWNSSNSSQGLFELLPSGIYTTAKPISTPTTGYIIIKMTSTYSHGSYAIKYSSE